MLNFCTYELRSILLDISTHPFVTDGDTESSILAAMSQLKKVRENFEKTGDLVSLQYGWEKVRNIIKKLSKSILKIC